MLESFGLGSWLDGDDFVRLALRLVLDLAFAAIVIRWIHYRLFRNRELMFTYLLFNLITFALCFLLREVPMELGFALGLFAVFGILRYRTEPIRPRDLTYLFVVIGLAILNAVANDRISLAELLLLDAAIVGLTWMMACVPFGRREEVRLVLYDNLELLKPGQDAALKEDLAKRTGLEVIHVEVGDLNLMRDTARLAVTCAAVRPTDD